MTKIEDERRSIISKNSKGSGSMVKKNEDYEEQEIVSMKYVNNSP